ncbi:DUF1934 domain-containing protein [uncultured Anaeromusa sp.]|uniref:DUF1934 domain-containing protein n=1 Tax=uncultured Anaeromusa sp. TaxID=673273 RepID=UPI0029C86EF9|nr:DUF1934 domain-containing protein [uncultured Anaeromusa sp.]
MKRVFVTITGRQKDVYDQEQCQEMTVAGTYYRRNGVDYISYREREEDGLGQTTTLLKIYEDRTILVRRGDVEQEQEFRRGERTESGYATPYGKLSLGIMTKEYSWLFGQASGAVDITYDLEIDGQWQSTNQLSVMIREEQICGH